MVERVPLRERLGRALLKTGQPSSTVVAQQHAQGLDFGSPFSPGAPLQPWSGVGGEPRRFAFPTGYNIQTRADRDKRVSFQVLKDLIDNYDIARMAIGHRIDDLRSLDWSIVAQKGYDGDSDAAVAAAYAFLKHPEGPGSRTTFRAWLAAYLEDVLRYDAGCLFRRRDRAGRVIGLKVVSGMTIAPMLDYWGDTPTGEAPAFVQFVQGLPWKWFSQDDLIYAPFRPQADSPYGFAPLEAILLTANTDIRFQVYFLNYFTDGTIPEGFGIAPEGWTPDQIEEFQAKWEALLRGDEAAKHQIHWVPNGSDLKFRDKTFDDKFPMYLMRKVAAAYHVTPNDLGFTDDVNRSSSDAQIDVQFRIGTKPLGQHVKDILDSVLQDDLGLPVEFQWDFGEQNEDRLTKAQAHDIYVKMGAESVDEVREGELGLPIDNERPIPRFVFSPRTGPVPLESLLAVAGPIDPATAAPTDGVPLAAQPFDGTPGILPDKQPGGTEFKRAPINPDEPEFPALEHPVPGTDVVAKPTPVTKDITAGVSVATGLAGVDLLDDDDEDEDAAELEKAAFTRFVKARRRAGKWRDFVFQATDPVTAHRLNQDGRASIRKAAGDLVAAGLAVRALDTGRFLMLQRALDPSDAAGGTWEFPGGHIEDGEAPVDAAVREWQEETGLLLPVTTTAPLAAMPPAWVASNGVYVGFVAAIPCEASLDVASRAQVTNPDDPDGDTVEAIAWWAPADLTGLSSLRAELTTDWPLVMAALADDDLDGDGRPDAPLLKSKGDPRWWEHPARHVEDALVDAHRDALQAGLADLTDQATLRRLAQAYLDQQPHA